MADILPGFSYSKSASRFRSDATGRFTSRSQITDLLDSQTSKLETRLSNLVTALHEGKLSPAYAAEQMRTELRRGHLQNRALGVGGFDRLTQKDFGSVGQKLRGDYARVTNLIQGIADGTVTLPQALNRVQGYAGSARTQFYEADAATRKEAAIINGMVLIARRTLSASEHCGGCLELYRRGWQPAEMMPLPGDGSTECGIYDKCHWMSREVTSAELPDWIGTMRG